MMIMKKQLLFLFLMMLPMVADAQYVEVDGIYYYLHGRYYTLKGNVAVVANHPDHYSGNVVIPSDFTYDGINYSVVAIDNAAFAYCTNLTSVIIPNSVNDIGYEAFANSSITNINIPDNVESIGHRAFEECQALTTITIGKGLKKIGENAFNNCSNLKSVTIDANAIVSADYYTPSQSLCCIFGSHVEEFIIGESVTKIGKYALAENYYRSYLTKVKLPNRITNIGVGAFEKSAITSIFIPASVESIGGDAFLGCVELTSVYISDLSSWCKLSFGNRTSNPLILAKQLFINNEAVKDLVIPSDVESIEKYAFCGSNIASVTIPESVKSIGDGAFLGCTSLDTVKVNIKIPLSITEIVFTNRTNASLIVPKQSKELYKNAKYWNEFKSIDEFHLPHHKLTYFVDGIQYAEYNIEESEEITPEPTPTKEGYTFSGWSEIPATMPAHDVTITGTFTINKYKLTYMVDGAEYKSYDVEYGATITPEAVPTKEGYTFSGWSEVPATMPAHDVTITGTFTKIDYVVDETTYEIQNDEVSVKDGSKQSGEVEIQTTVVINGQTYKVTSIADNAFKGNTSITSVTIPNSITQIGASAFEGCSSLSEINIGNAVGSIGNKAFASITSASNAPRRTLGTRLKVNCYAESVPSTASNAFENSTISNSTLLVEDKSVTAYKNSAPWSGFGTIMGFKEATSIDRIWADENGKAKIFSIDGKPLNTPQKGVVIIRMNNGETRKVVAK